MQKVCVPTILTRYHDDLAIGAVSEGCTLSSLEAKVQPLQVSPCQAGLAGQRLSVSTRFLLSQHALVPFGFRRLVVDAVEAFGQIGVQHIFALQSNTKANGF